MLNDLIRLRQHCEFCNAAVLGISEQASFASKREGYVACAEERGDTAMVDSGTLNRVGCIESKVYS